MDIAGVALALLIIFMSSVFLMSKGTQSGGSPSGWSPISIDQDTLSPYSQQINELDNIDFVLKRKQVPGNPVINKLEPIDEAQESHVLPKKSINDIPKTEVSLKDKANVETIQPYFLDEALIVNYYGVPHYWDWRYPKQPLPLEFAKDPQRFVKEHPEIYPSYVIRSRTGIPEDNNPLETNLAPAL